MRANLTLDDVSVAGNFAEQLGGGIMNLGEILLIGTDIEDNSAHIGGGVYNIPESDIKLIDSRAEGNIAEGGQGDDIFQPDIQFIYDDEALIVYNMSGHALDIRDVELKGVTGPFKLNEFRGVCVSCVESIP